MYLRHDGRVGTSIGCDAKKKFQLPFKPPHPRTASGNNTHHYRRLCRKSLALDDMPLRLTPVHVSIVVHLVSWKVVNHTQTFLGALIRRIPRGRVSRVLTPVARVQVDNSSNGASESLIFPSIFRRRQMLEVWFLALHDRSPNARRTNATLR